ncbi:6065_t:CDS:2 [Acaulospora colombiana]|uniref:6065_t:CDS:1 n=1 Tax=Acaulospora colombiana TaxID=27376 RepID=A0ACA9M0A9_9GLOM|nr:6065_t:CDS:2 [Acaulospora colombiana]
MGVTGIEKHVTTKFQTIWTSTIYVYPSITFSNNSSTTLFKPSKPGSASLVLRGCTFGHPTITHGTHPHLHPCLSNTTTNNYTIPFYRILAIWRVSSWAEVVDKEGQRLYDVGTDKLNLVNEYELEAGADAPMSMAYDPTVSLILFTHPHFTSLTLLSWTINDITGDAYQKVTVLSPSNDILAVGSSTNEPQHWKCLRAIYSTSPFPPPGMGGEGENGDVEEQQLESLELATTLIRPKIRSQGKDVSSFRAVRFHPKDFSILYAVLNTTSTTGKRSRKSYIVKYGWTPHLKSWPVIAQRKIGDGSITSFDIRCVSL